MCKDVWFVNASKTGDAIHTLTDELPMCVWYTNAVDTVSGDEWVIISEYPTSEDCKRVVDWLSDLMCQYPETDIHFVGGEEVEDMNTLEYMVPEW